jgi:site-specific recombinase XerD
MQEVIVESYSDIFGSKSQKWLGKYPISNSEEIKQWIIAKAKQFERNGKGSKSASDFQASSYLNQFQKFCDAKQINDIKELFTLDVAHRNELVMSYLSDLLKKPDINEVSIVNDTQSKIKSFFSYHKIDVTDQMECFKRGKNENELMITDKESLRLFKARLSGNYLLIFEMETNTGLRIKDVLEELTREVDGEPKYHFKKYQNHFYIPDFLTTKESVFINFLFITTECEKIWLSVYGKDCENDLTKLDLRTIFMNRLGTNRITASDYLDRLKDIAKEIGIEENIKTHELRKFYTSTVENIDLGNVVSASELKEHLIGHKPKGLTTYSTYLNNIDWVYKLWLKIEPKVSIDVVDRTDMMVKEANEEIIKLKEDKLRKDEQIELLIKANMNIKENLEKKDTILDQLLKDYEELKATLTNALETFKKSSE